MVMRNRHNPTGSMEWWEDLPPRIRMRITASCTSPTYPADDILQQPETNRPCPAHSTDRGRWRQTWNELALLLLAFVTIVIVNLAILVVAIAYVASGPGTFKPMVDDIAW